MMLIGDLVRLNARRFKNKIALKDEVNQFTFNEIYKRAKAIVNALMDRGVKKGERVGLLLFNCAEYGELLYGLPLAGFVTVPMNYRLRAKELRYIINDSKMNTLIFGENFIDVVNEMRSDIKTVNNFIVLGRNRNGTDALKYSDLIQSSTTAEISADVSESDLAYILYTSGTTGYPKGAMLTHRNMITNIINSTLELQIQGDETHLNMLPMYHAAAQSGVNSYFFYGCTSILLKQFDPVLTLETIKKEKPDVASLVPAMQNMIVNHPDVSKYDLTCVKLIIYGASPMLVPQLKRSMEVFKCRFIQFAGQTEASPVLTCLRPEDHIVESEVTERRLSSAGKEARLTEVKIVNEHGDEVPPNTPGEEIARGPNVMQGYWNLPEATAESLVDGWLHTGDICMKDEEGYIYYVDRIKDLIVRGGENVYPREIEEVIATHPNVLEVAVIGVPDERVQEEIMACIVLKKGTSATEKEIVDLCEKNLAKFKKPRLISFVESLPKNPSGKVLKRELRKIYG
jgi:acyl-CoA synthetase (AMP-forming)/AMP-acid ligase II